MASSQLDNALDWVVLNSFTGHDQNNTENEFKQHYIKSPGQGGYNASKQAGKQAGNQADPCPVCILLVSKSVPLFKIYSKFCLHQSIPMSWTNWRKIETTLRWSRSALLSVSNVIVSHNPHNCPWSDNNHCTLMSLALLIITNTRLLVERVKPRLTYVYRYNCWWCGIGTWNKYLPDIQR